jgi:hypothetical protein
MYVQFICKYSLAYRKSLKITRKITPGIPQKPAIRTVTTFTPRLNPQNVPIKFALKRSISPNIQFNTITLINLKDLEKLLAIKNTAKTTSKKAIIISI